MGLGALEKRALEGAAQGGAQRSLVQLETPEEGRFEGAAVVSNRL